MTGAEILAQVREKGLFVEDVTILDGCVLLTAEEAEQVKHTAYLGTREDELKMLALLTPDQEASDE